MIPSTWCNTSFVGMLAVYTYILVVIPAPHASVVHRLSVFLVHAAYVAAHSVDDRRTPYVHERKRPSYDMNTRDSMVWGMG